MKNLILIACLLAVTACGMAQSDGDQIHAAYVRGVIELQAALPKKGNIFPWVVVASREVLFSNACGFGQATYNTCPPGGVIDCTGKLRAIFLRGEWCDVRDYVYDDPTVLILRRWKGEDYIVDSSEPMPVKNGRPFIVDLAFIEEWGLSSALETLPKDEACLDTRWLTPDQLNDFARDQNSTVGDKELCFLRGVSVTNLLQHFSGNSLQPIEVKDGASVVR